MASLFFNTGRDFTPYYKKIIRPKVAVFEAARIKALASLRMRIITSIPIALIVMGIVAYIGFYKMPNFDPSLLIIGCIAVISGLFTWCRAPYRKFKTSVKDQIFPLIFNFFEGGFRHTMHGPLNVNMLDPSGIIPDYTTEHTGDYVSGQYKGVALELLEATLTKTEGTGKNKRTVTVFNGLFVVLAAHKKFKGRTLVKKDFGIMGWVINNFESLKRVKLEDPVFEKQFEVFASDQVEARYLLTTSFMDRLLKLINLFKSKGLECSFYDSKLLIKIPTNKNYFETSSIFKPVTFVAEINTVLEEMHTFFSIIETLKLHEKTGL